MERPPGAEALQRECVATNMEEQRDVQTSRRACSSRPANSAASALAMEIKRKKIRESTLFSQAEATDLQEKLDFEMRMRDGAYKLLLACSKRDQVLSAAKNLQTCNTRIKAYFSQLQRRREEADRGLSDPLPDGRIPCIGKLAISGLRIPLLWRDTDHFNDRGSSRRVAVFCLMRIDSEVFDTDMVVVDRSVTDICFDGVTIFNDVVPQFQLRVELWSCSLEEEPSLVNTPRKLAKKLRSSFGKSSGKKLCPLLDGPDSDTFMQHNPTPPGAKYSLLAHTTLSLPQAEGSFQSHSLIVLQDAAWSSWLPLYGNLCCRLAAQPAAMTRTMRSGYLSHKQTVDGTLRCCRLFCVLSAASLSCFFAPEDIDAKVPPALSVPVNKDTRVHLLEKHTAQQRSSSLTLINPSAGGTHSHVFAADSRDELDAWLDALHQHLYDQGQWLHCCDQLMKIEVASPRKPSLFLTKQADSVYEELSIQSPSQLESITDIIHSKIQETDGCFLIGWDQRREAPDWSALFDGSRPVTAQSGAPSPGRSLTPCSSPAPNTSSTPTSNKKRRAPPPPPDTTPYAPPTAPPPAKPQPPRPPPPAYRQKENVGAARPATRSRTGRPSLDAKFSAIIQQLQRSNAAAAAGPSGRRNAPLGRLDVQPQGQNQQARAQVAEDQHHGLLTATQPAGPVPLPRCKVRKSFREKMSLKAP